MMTIARLLFMPVSFLCTPVVHTTTKHSKPFSKHILKPTLQTDTQGRGSLYHHFCCSLSSMGRSSTLKTRLVDKNAKPVGYVYRLLRQPNALSNVLYSRLHLPASLMVTQAKWKCHRSFPPSLSKNSSTDTLAVAYCKLATDARKSLINSLKRAW